MSNSIYKIGDLVGCYDSPETKKVIIGWIEDIQTFGEIENIYYIRWSDKLHKKELMEINEEDMWPFVELIEKIKSELS